MMLWVSLQTIPSAFYGRDGSPETWIDCSWDVSSQPALTATLPKPKPQIALSVYPRTLTRTWNWTRTLPNQRMRWMASSSLLMGYHFRAPPQITNPTRARRRRVTETALRHAQTGRPSSPDEATYRKRHQDTQRSAVNLSRSTGYRKPCCGIGIEVT